MANRFCAIRSRELRSLAAAFTRGLAVLVIFIGRNEKGTSEIGCPLIMDRG